MTNNSNANVHGVVSNSIHKFPWQWRLSDIESSPKNGMKVFSCFSCGGGSSMGYKLAGYNVIGNVEIDPRMMQVYRKNNHPQYPFLMDIREFLKIPDEELPEELFQLDILDGSPPCSVFSTAGEREKGWNKEKVFREGQAKQRLDDLFFWFIDIARKLQPRVVVAENVAGLLRGQAKGYVNEILHAFDAAGYKTQLFLLNSAYMGVLQKRERCFFVAQRKDQQFPKLSLSFKETPICFGAVRTPEGIEPEDGVYKELLKRRKPTDKSIGDISKRVRGKDAGFNNTIWPDDEPAGTVVASGSHYRGYDGKKPTIQDYINVQTFPQDYAFEGQPAQYICGMSVPPVMMAQIASEINRQWFAGGDPNAQRYTSQQPGESAKG